MAATRFIDEEAIDGTVSVRRVWDSTFLLPRAVRSLSGLSPEAVGAVRARVRALSRVRHPALPPLVAIGEEGGDLRLVESWVEGQSLAEFTAKHGPLAVGRGLAVVSPVVDALRIAHELGLGHGAIDTRSVMVDHVGVPQLVGLGARATSPADDLPDLGTLMGEVFEEPWPDTLRSLIDETSAGQLTSLTDLFERLRLIREDLPSIEDPLDADFAFDFEFDPDDGFDEIAVAGDRRVLAAVALGIAAIVGVGVYGTFLAPDAPVDDGPIAEGPAEPPTPDMPQQDGDPLERAVAADPPTFDADEVSASNGVDPTDRTGAGPAPRAAPPMSSRLGKWRIEVDPGSAAMVVLDAENEVADRLHTLGRPQLAVVCTGDGLSAQLWPGVHRVEAVADEASYAIHAQLQLSRDGRAGEPLQAKLVAGDGNVYLPTPGILTSLHHIASVTVTYAPFAADPVVAVFDVRGIDAAVAELGHCG